jgi:hypothetical protein
MIFMVEHFLVLIRCCPVAAIYAEPLQIMKKYDKQDQKLMATWAADCAERVLPFFEKAYPQDDRPRKAIEACRTWVRTGVFKMADIRGASLAAHAAARETKENNAACFAARAAGQAVATAHVPQHAFGSAYYALKVIVAADPAQAEVQVTKEHDWQAEHMPAVLRQEVLKRVIVQKRAGGIFIKVQKDKDF